MKQLQKPIIMHSVTVKDLTKHNITWDIYKFKKDANEAVSERLQFLSAVSWTELK